MITGIKQVTQLYPLFFQHKIQGVQKYEIEIFEDGRLKMKIDKKIFIYHENDIAIIEHYLKSLGKHTRRIYSEGEKYFFVVDERELPIPCEPINICLAHKTKPCDKCKKYQGHTILLYHKLDNKAEDLNYPKL